MWSDDRCGNLMCAAASPRRRKMTGVSLMIEYYNIAKASGDISNDNRWIQFTDDSRVVIPTHLYDLVIMNLTILDK